MRSPSDAPRILALSVCVVLTVMTHPAPAPADEKQLEKLVLTTDRFPHPLSLRESTGAGFFRIGLEVTLDGKGGGKGILILDPNARVVDDFGDGTAVWEIGWRRDDVTLEEIKKDDPEKKGRRLYQVKGEKLKSKFFFVHSPDPKEPHRILATVFPQRRETSVYPLRPVPERRR